jgi:peroxiredoxin
MNLVSKKNTVLVFYRGGWCPFCSAHLSELGNVKDAINNMGYQIIAIAPDSPKKLAETTEKGDLSYKVYSDASGELIQAMGIAFKAPDRYDQRLAFFSNDLNPGLLPVPSVFVIDTEGTILFEYISPNYRNRMGGKLLLSVLETLD